MGLWGQILLLTFLIFCSGFFSGSETALTSLGKLRTKQLMMELDSDRDSRFKRLLKYWLDNSQDMLISILIGNNMVNIGASALATVVATELFRRFGLRSPLVLGSGVAVGVMTFLILLFGEITPKSYAKENPEKFSRFILPPMMIFTRVIYPLIYLMRIFTQIIIWFMGARMPNAQTAITEEELKSLVLAGREEGTLEESELKMLHSVFEFDETVVREIMVPRTDIRAIDVDVGLDDVIETARETGYSRIPVYEDKLDQIIGILNIKDLLNHYIRDELEKFDLGETVRPAYFVPESKKVNQLLGEFRRNQVHLAIVVDEYGGTSGLITLEDILEQIVGEIQDEYDQERDWALEVQDGTYLIDARIDLDDLVDRLEVNLPAAKYDSLGGMVVQEMGEIPDEGDEFAYNDLDFVIVSADEKRVKKVRMIIHDDTDDQEKETDGNEVQSTQSAES